MTIAATPTLRRFATRLPGGLHYSWVIVALLALVQILSASIGMAAGVVVAPLSDPEGGFGWSIGTVGAALMVYYFVGATFAPISGWLGDRYGARKLMLTGGALYFVSMLLLGVITQPWHFFITFGVMLAITQSFSMVPLMVAVSFWFRRRLGLGVGLLWAAGGAGTAAPGRWTISGRHGGLSLPSRCASIHGTPPSCWQARSKVP